MLDLDQLSCAKRACYNAILYINELLAADRIDGTVGATIELQAYEDLLLRLDMLQEDAREIRNQIENIEADND